MKTNTKIAALALAGFAVVGSTAMASAATRSDQPASPPTSASELTEAQKTAIAAVGEDAPIPVLDRDGERRGFVRDSDLTERDDRVTARIVADFREARGPADPDYDRLYEALRVLDPVEVRNEEGEVVGAFTSHFLTLEEARGAVPAAEATIAELLAPS